ncbi:uracil phosphoribosyltransferase [Tenacibaculum retecalamus]|uniref:uracil phosphoribosyltransferase n=1 Tax=Tenacibaculum retecalamus TaxID=3018315 RepID=UPI0023D92FBB|nr:uracil phosphoribosyltransferase [Tenacibaculum retecalamus]WBX71135.1 uracil phosphoribosyltransferase [Tenacibaculum retecalamus]
MKIHHLAKEKSILNKFLAEIRNVAVQKDSMRFRRNIERIGEVLGYELSKKLSFKNKDIKTPLGVKAIETPVKDVILCSILRAGLPLHNGLLNYFDDAENAFISAYRHHPNNDEEFEIVVEYFASPSIDGKTLLLVDPMLATGRSLVAVYEAIKKYGTPKKIEIVSVIGSAEGVKYIKGFFPENTDLWIADIDEGLNDKGYIVPGLGDAGDLAYGSKM